MTNDDKPTSATQDPTTAPRPVSAYDVDYKGEPLDAERGPGLGCFWTQIVVLVILLVLTPLSVNWGWPSAVSAALLFIVILILLFSGQTVIFLLRLVAAERREGRRVPLASETPTVGELEDQAPATGGTASAGTASDDDLPHGYNPFPPKGDGGVRE